MSISQTADRLLSNAITDGAVPGVVAGATDRDGNLYLGGFGERVLGGGEEMTAGTVGWIASMTKPLTGAAAMQLVERGQLDLDAPAREVVPALGEARVLEGFEEDGTPRTRAPRGDITLRHLLTHTAGFSYETWSASILTYQAATGTPGIISCQEAALGTPLLFDPGDRWEYGISIDWIGKMVEAVSGQRLGVYFRDHLLEPLGMRDTAFRITDGMRARLAKIHQRVDDGSLVPLMDLEMPQDPEVELGGAGLYGTIGDYLCFIRMMLNGGRVNGEQILAPETVATMSRNQMGTCRVVPLKTVIPPFSNDADFFPGMPKTWGLTFMINTEDTPTGRSAGSLAWAGLANSYFWIDQAKGVGGAYMTQVLPFADEKSLPLYLAFESAVYGNLD
ncbi:MAG: serine hydrolase [Gammaproteobacteria bacterium]|nr:serine hydrolase [Gammaproteobacteria bacterium]MDE0452293.1 serine hydrolase [Gammaproteobacteria bacterium]